MNYDKYFMVHQIHTPLASKLQMILCQDQEKLSQVILGLSRAFSFLLGLTMVPLVDSENSCQSLLVKTTSSPTDSFFAEL